MRGNKRHSRHTTPRPRYRSVVLLSSLALVVSQSMGIIAANALDPSLDASTFSAWGSSSTTTISRGDSADEGQGGGSSGSGDGSTRVSPHPTEDPGTEPTQDANGDANGDANEDGNEPDSAGDPTTTLRVQPTLVEGNPTCEDLTESTHEFRINAPDVENDVFDDPDSELVVTITGFDDPEGFFDWSSNLGLDAVFVKGGPVGDLYEYDDATADTDLHTPINGNNNRHYGISHISFCWNDQPDLTITKAAQDLQGEPITSIPLGGTFNYVITVTNIGNASASPVIVTDDLNDSLTVNLPVNWDKNPPDAGTDGTCGVTSGNTVSCPSTGTITLASADTTTNGGDDTLRVVINVTVPENLRSCPTLANSAQVRIGQGTPSTAQSAPVTVTGCAPSLTITKQARNAQGAPITSIPLGGTFNYVITVTNSGNASASPVIVTDNLNDSLTINGSVTWDKNPPDAGTDGTCAVTSGNTVSCPFTGTINLAASDEADNGDDTLQVVINVTVPENLGSCPALANSAQVQIGEGTPSTAQSAPVQVTGCAPGLTITKQGPASVGQGGQITYTVTVQNTGNEAASGVVVTDNLDDSLTNVSGTFGEEDTCTVGTNPSNSNDANFVTCELGTVGAGSTATITINATAPTGVCATITNQASVTFGIEGPTITSDIVTTTVTGCVPPPPPPPPSPIGINIDKSGLALAHVGDTVTYTFAVTLTTSTPLSNITVVDPICSAAPTLVSMNGGDQDTTLEPGETWNFSCTHVVTASDPDPLPNTASVTGTAPDGRNTSDTDSHSVDIIHPAIRIVKTADPTSASPGDTVTYTYRVTNTGDVTLFDVNVTDNKLGDICTIAQLDVGETETCTATFRVPDRAAPVDNVGVAEGDDVTGFSVRDQDDASVDVVLGTTVTPPPTTTPPGGVAFTGAGGVIPLAGLALLLLLAGSGILFVTRRPEDGSEA